jgi:hypothetical protein
MPEYLTWTIKVSVPVSIERECYDAMVEDDPRHGLPPFDEWLQSQPQHYLEDDNLYTIFTKEIISEPTIETLAAS